MKNGKYIKATGIQYRGFFSEHSKSKTQLQPLYEAFTNSLEAIKINKSKKNNHITINLKFNGNLFSHEHNDYKLHKSLLKTMV